MAATYPGQEADAQWRKDAWARIEQNRKSDFDIQVVGENGAPVSRAKVNVALQKHDFDFGTAVNKAFLDETNERGRRLSKYLRLFLTLRCRKNELEAAFVGVESGHRKAEVSTSCCPMTLTCAGTRWFGTGGISCRRRLKPIMRLMTLSGWRQRRWRTFVRLAVRFRAICASGMLRMKFCRITKCASILGDETLVKWYQEAKKADPARGFVPK